MKFLEMPSIDPRMTLTAYYLEWAVKDLFPGVELGEVMTNGPYFGVNVAGVPAEMLRMVEERMRGLMKAEHRMRVMEMVADNGATFLKHRGMKREVGEGIIKVLELGEFVDVCLDERVVEVEPYLDFQLLEGSILGVAGAEKGEMKGHVKRWKREKRWDPQKVWRRKEMGQWLKLEQLWRESVKREGIELFWTEGDLIKCVMGLGDGRWATLDDRLFTVCSEEKIEAELTYSLQLIEKSYKMLGFSPQWVLTLSQTGYHRGNQVVKRCERVLSKGCSQVGIVDRALSLPERVLVVSDRLGRLWEGPRVTVNFKEGMALLEWGLFGLPGAIVSLLAEESRAS